MQRCSTGKQGSRGWHLKSVRSSSLRAVRQAPGQRLHRHRTLPPGKRASAMKSCNHPTSGRSHLAMAQKRPRQRTWPGTGPCHQGGGGKRQRAVKRRTSQRRVSVVQPCGLCPSPHQHIAGRVLCALCGEPARQGRGTGMKTTTNLKSIFHRTKSDTHSIQPIDKK